MPLNHFLSPAIPLHFEGWQKTNKVPLSQGKILKPDLGAPGAGQRTTEDTSSSPNLKGCALANFLRLSLHQMESQMLRPVARDGFKNMQEPETGPGPLHDNR